MTTLFPVDKQKINEFMSSMDLALESHNNLKSKQYSFDFKLGIPLIESKPLSRKQHSHPIILWELTKSSVEKGL